MTAGRIFLGTLVALVVLLVLWSWQLLRPGPPIRLSKQTTYITEPLGDDGLPDYVAYLDRKYSEGVTPENNAAVLLLRAAGPGHFDAQQQDVLYTRLGMEHLPKEGDYLVSPRDKVAFYDHVTSDAVAAWLVDVWEGRHNSDDTGTVTRGASPLLPWANQAAIDVYSTATRRPWTSQQIPPLVDWLDAYKTRLDFYIVAAQRTRMYTPPVDATDVLPSLYAYESPASSSDGAALDGLMLRGMRNIGEGRYADVQTDAVAAQRLGRMISSGPFMFNYRHGMNFFRIACIQQVVLSAQPDVPESLLLVVLDELLTLPRWQRAVDVLNEDDRLMGLDAVITVRRDPGRFTSFTGANNMKMKDWLAGTTIDWNIALRRVNEYFDEYVAALRIKDRVTRNDTLHLLDVTLIRQRSDIERRMAMSTLNIEARSELIAEFVARLLLLSPGGWAKYQDRANLRLDMTITAVAIAVFRARHGEYPPALTALVPDVLAEVPDDSYSGQPFKYERRDDGYVLYSVGDNGTDDGGSNAVGHNDCGYIVKGDWVAFDWLNRPSVFEADFADDIVIRAPIPVFEIPPRPTPAQMQ